MDTEAQNPLARWLAVKEMKRSDFAVLIGVTPGRISQICDNGVSHFDVMKRIEEATGGDIPAEAWLKPAPAPQSPEAAA